MKKSINYKDAPRVNLSAKYNESHLKKWRDYAKDMELGEFVTIEDVQDFAEVLLGEKKVSVNNYLSTVLTFHIENGTMIESPFFERRYGKIRERVRKMVRDCDPEQADPFLLEDE